MFFTPLIVTYVSIRTCDTSTVVPTFRFNGLHNAPLPCLEILSIRSFGIWFEPRYIFRAGRLD